MIGKLLAIVLASLFLVIGVTIVSRGTTMNPSSIPDATEHPGTFARPTTAHSVSDHPGAIRSELADRAVSEGLPRPALPTPATAATTRLSYSYPDGYALGGAGGAVGIGDVTGDGVLDVAVVVAAPGQISPCRVLVYSRIQGASGLSPVAEHPLDTTCDTFFGGIAVGDINGDGVADVVIGTNEGVAILASNGNGGLTLHSANVGRRVMQVGLLDVDRDGKQDVVGLDWGGIMGNYYPDAATIFHGDGLGGIARWSPFATPQRGYNDLKIADVTGDGLPDLVMASAQSFYFWVIPLASGGGFLAPIAYPAPDQIWVTSAIAVADLNSDGRKDIVVNTPANFPRAALWVYLQRPDGSLDVPIRLDTLDLPGPMLGADLDADWLDDIAVFHPGWDALGTYLQRPEGGMSVERLDDAAAQDLMNRQAIAAGDLDGDGCMDVATTYGNSLAVMWSENCAPRRRGMGGNLPPFRVVR